MLCLRVLLPQPRSEGAFWDLYPLEGPAFLSPTQAAAPALISMAFIPVSKEALVPCALSWASAPLHWSPLAGSLTLRVPSRLGGFLLFCNLSFQLRSINHH